MEVIVCFYGRVCYALSYFDGGIMFNLLEKRNKSLKRINESLRKENEALKQELSLYDLDKLNEQLELSNNMYEEYKKLIDELRDMKMKYKILICDIRKESI
ncbi:hypothetical protein [Roseburia sp. 1XD42-69]|uniref:hypothetical protein n=1 Tax=Roseburia sp. 1XD42-69 TaxID=2320088 RepID=UPI000EA0F798|nr:hypothetical protein [Roseburia sp. 1XD42-69]RKJ59815.1 hypothetical protein D7Y06_25340 [Roseburia sp. 1XD42-69]